MLTAAMMNLFKDRKTRPTQPRDILSLLTWYQTQDTADLEDERIDALTAGLDLMAAADRDED